MKSYDIIGYAFEGSLYCPRCFDDEYKESANPIFAGNNEADIQMSCAQCHEEIDTSIISKEGMLMRITNRLIDEYKNYSKASIEIGKVSIEMGNKGLDTFIRYDIVEPIEGDWNYVFHDFDETFGDDLQNFDSVYNHVHHVFKDKSLEDIYID